MTQGSIPRPRSQKNPRPRPKTDFPRRDPLEAKNRNAQGQGPRTQRARKRSSRKKSLTFAKFQAFSETKKKERKKRSSQIFREVSGILEDEEKKRT